MIHKLFWTGAYNWVQVKDGKKFIWSKAGHNGPESNEWIMHYYERPRFALHRWYLRKYKSSYYP